MSGAGSNHPLAPAHAARFASIYCETGAHSMRSRQEIEFLKGAEWRQMSPPLRQAYIERAFHYWRERGFPYYLLDEDQIRRQFQQLVATRSRQMFLPDGKIQWSNVGLALANYFHPQMWSIKSDSYLSPIECFKDDKLLKACIQRALEIWPDRYGANPSNLPLKANLGSLILLQAQQSEERNDTEARTRALKEGEQIFVRLRQTGWDPGFIAYRLGRISRLQGEFSKAIEFLELGKNKDVANRRIEAEIVKARARNSQFDC